MPPTPTLTPTQKVVASLAGFTAAVALAVASGVLPPMRGQFSIGGMDHTRTFVCAAWDTLLVIRAADSVHIRIHADTIVVPSNLIHIDTAVPVQLAMVCSGSRTVVRLPPDSSYGTH